MISPGAPEKAILVEGLVKDFGYHRVLQGLNLAVDYGDFLTILGPNGAGKTTLLKILATLIRPTSGRVLVAGLDPGTQSREIRRHIGVVGHHTLLYGDLSAYENLRFYGRMYDVPDLEERIAGLLHFVGLYHRGHDRVRTFSHGMQKRLTIARALLHRPRILLLDEPEAGLDREAARSLWELLRTYSEGETAVVMTTHNMERALDAGNRLTILSKGRIVFDQPRKSLVIENLEEIYYHYAGVER
jgi:heme ABC exporter ATP-binding subunit CcmA